MLKGQSRILFFSLSGIGNYIMQAPTIASLRQHRPKSHITVWVAPKGTKPLAEADPNVDEVVQMPIKTSPSEHVKQIANLRRRKYDVGIVLSPGQLSKSAFYAYAAGIPMRVGNSYPFRGNLTSSFLLTDAVEELPDTHDIEQNLRLLEPLGMPVSSDRAVNYDLQFTDKHKQEAETLLKKLSIPHDRTLVGFHAGSSPELAFKRWPLDRFADLGRSLIENHNGHILIFGGRDEETQKRELQKAIEDRHPNKTSAINASLLSTAAIMKQCKLMISNDSGLMHLASAVGVETFGLFGPTSETLTGPRGSKAHVIRAPHTEPVFNTESNFDLGNDPHQTILAIKPKIVLDKVASIL